MSLTVKQEAFCQAYLQTGGNASEAYRQSYDVKKSTDKTIWEASSRLLADSKVAARIVALREALVKKSEITVGDILAELEDARTVAREGDRPQASAMVAAIMGKAKVLGFVVDKAQISADVKITLFDNDQAKRMAQRLLSGAK